MIRSCKPNGFVPFAYTKGPITAFAPGHPQAWIDELPPWNFPVV